MVRYGIALLHMPGSVGGVSMEHIVWDKGSRFYKLGQSMDKIGSNQAVYKENHNPMCPSCMKKRKHADICWVVMKKGGQKL